MDDLTRALGESAIRSLARDLLLDGAFDEASLTLPTLRAAARSELRRLLDSGEKIVSVRTHAESLLTRAKRYAARGDHEFAIIFYATFVEHRLNGMIAHRRSRSEGERELHDVMKSQLALKTGRVWVSTFGAPLREDLRQAILALAQERNEFVHYKWGPAFGGHPAALDRKQRESIGRAEWVTSELGLLDRSLHPSLAPDIVGWLYD